MVGVGVSVYLERLIGCAVRFGSDIDTVLAEAVQAALADRRYVTLIDAASRCALTTVVSLLYEPRWLGAMSDSRLPMYFRLGRDTLSARGENGSGLVLAQFAAQQGIDENAYSAQVRRKAGQSEGPVRWTAYDTASWVVADGSVRRLEYGLPIRDRFAAEVRDQCVALAGEIAEHVLEMQATDGIPAYTFNMWTGRDSGTAAGTSTRMLIAAGGLLKCARYLHPNLHDAAARLVDEFTPQAGPGPPRDNLSWDSGSEAQLLQCLTTLAPSSEQAGLRDGLGARLQQLIRSDGAIYPSGPKRLAADLDILSGLVILALSEAHKYGANLDNLDLSPTLAFYRRRFTLTQPWAMVWWHAQAWLAAAVPGAQQFGFELVDWALARQSRTSGAFVIDTVPPYRNSFLTACMLEGVADAWRVAKEIGDSDRAAEYRDAWQRGVTFIERLVVRPGDQFFGPNGTRAVGGVRPTLVSSRLRIDYAGHALYALAKGLNAMGTD